MRRAEDLDAAEATRGPVTIDMKRRSSAELGNSRNVLDHVEVTDILRGNGWTNMESTRREHMPVDVSGRSRCSSRKRVFASRCRRCGFAPCRLV